MYFILFATDKVGMAKVREEIRPTHRHYLKHSGYPVNVLLGGPTLDDGGDKMNGTMLVIEAKKLQDVKDFAADDPYVHAGLFEKTEIRPWMWSLGTPEK